jgi:hypothetical protein
MAIEVYPIPSTSGGIQSYAVTVPEINKQYKSIQPLDPGVYLISISPTAAIATIIFFNDTSTLLTSTTSSGSINANLASAATHFIVSINSNAGATVTIAYQSSAIPGTEISGTLDTITSTGTYNQTGKLAVLAFGGGGGGGAGAGNQACPGAAGSTPGFAIVYTNSATSVTIGAQGNGGNTNSNGNLSNAGNSGGTTNFGNLVSSSGTSGTGPAGLDAGPGLNWTQAGRLITNPYQSIKSGTNGGGAWGYRDVAAAGAGSGIGTGGGVTPMTAATGYGAGGAGGNWYTAGTAGSPGVIYVLRGF